jgi:hypothetical protein
MWALLRPITEILTFSNLHNSSIVYSNCQHHKMLRWLDAVPCQNLFVAAAKKR